MCSASSGGSSLSKSVRDGHVDGEHIGGFGAGVQDAGVLAVSLQVAGGGREAFGGCVDREVQPDAGLVRVQPR